jgi:hypothetical protein
MSATCYNFSGISKLNMQVAKTFFLNTIPKCRKLHERWQIIFCSNVQVQQSSFRNLGESSKLKKCRLNISEFHPSTIYIHKGERSAAC